MPRDWRPKAAAGRDRGCCWRPWRRWAWAWVGVGIGFGGHEVDSGQQRAAGGERVLDCFRHLAAALQEPGNAM